MKRKAKRMKPSTTNRYRRALASRILPELGHLTLDELERQHVLEWVEAAESAEKECGERYATATVQGWWRVFLQVLKDAHADGKLSGEVWRRIDAPDTGVRRRREQRTLTADELADLVEICRGSYPQRYAEVATLGYTGLRAGELYALEWDDIDLTRGRIVVSKSVWRAEHVTSTKTQDPRRVAAPDLVVDALEQHRERLMREQHPGLEQGLAFPADGGGYRLPQSIGKTLRAIEDDVETDVHLTPQVLRRTYNDLLRKAQVDRIVLREQMGHTDEPMTERYSSVDFDEKRDAVTRVFDEPREKGGESG